MKTGRLTLEAIVTVTDDHDVEKYLELLRKSFANTFSCGVHDSYPDAHVRTEVKVEPHRKLDLTTTPPPSPWANIKEGDVLTVKLGTEGSSLMRVKSVLPPDGFELEPIEPTWSPA